MHFESMMDTECFYVNDFCFMKYDDDDDDDEDDELILRYGWPAKGV